MFKSSGAFFPAPTPLLTTRPFIVALLATLWAITSCLAVPLVMPTQAIAAESPYGEVGRFPDSGGPAKATYGETTTSALTAGGFVDPVGMAVDPEDPTAPDGNAIYVLDNINPQALNEAEATTVKLEYRLQKLGEHGEVLGSRSFTLQSSETEPDLHATALALDGATNRVYVLIMGQPANGEGRRVADRIDAWSAGREAGESALAPAVNLSEDKLTEDKLTGAGELAGPDTAHHLQTGSAEAVGDIDGESLAIVGTGTDLALAGNEYSETGERSEAGTVPVIELLKTSALPGTVDKIWRSSASAEDSAAKAWSQKAEYLYSVSGNADGSLDVSLGPVEVSTLETKADGEPDVAEVSADLKTTTPILPWASAAEGSALGQLNRDRAATDGFGADNPLQAGLSSSGATRRAGSLVPDLIRLGSGERYAGLVANAPETDAQNPSRGLESWRVANGEASGGGVRSTQASALAIRVFDPQGDSLGMIANATPGGPCSLEGGSSQFGGAFSAFNPRGSFMALARGKNGALFALVQSELANTDEAGGLISPAAAVGAGSGDQIVEFAPGAGQAGAAGHACPQPSVGFSITNQSTAGSAASTGSNAITVPAGTKLKLDAGAPNTNLVGGSPWSYDWEAGTGSSSIDHQWSVNNLFTASPGSGPAWEWPSSTVEFTYATAGSYTAKLTLASDFGAATATRTINVVNPEPVSACFEAAAATAGQPVTLDASCSHIPQFDTATRYHWSFGDGEIEDTQSAQTQHVYASTGSYTAALTVEDALHQTAEVTMTVSVTAAASTPGGGGTLGGGTGGAGGSAGGSGGGNSTQTVNTEPTDVDARIASVASARGTVAVSVACPLGKASCSGTVVLKTAAAVKASASAKRHSRKRVGANAPLILGQVSFKLSGGAHETVQVRLSAKGLALLRAKHTLRVLATIAASDPGGHAKTVTQVFTLRAAPAKKKARKR
jgi:PKD repeat protein